jgi:hypothetical protein
VERQTRAERVNNADRGTVIRIRAGRKMGDTLRQHDRREAHAYLQMDSNEANDDPEKAEKVNNADSGAEIRTRVGRKMGDTLRELDRREAHVYLQMDPNEVNDDPEKERHEEALEAELVRRRVTAPYSEGEQERTVGGRPAV